MKFYIICCLLLYMITCDGYVCTVKQSKADCFNKATKSIPQDLPENITVLDLRQNLIANLDKYAFKNYKNLKCLYLDDNTLFSIHKHAFYGLDKLQNLSLANNRLDVSKVYINGTFTSLTVLKNLDISRNMPTTILSPVHYPFFGHLKKLVSLSVDLVTFPKFDKCGFQNIISLKRIMFDNCYVRHLSNETFFHLPKTIEEIYLKNCLFIRNVDSGTLHHLTNLQVLSIYHSNMELRSAFQLLFPYQNKSLNTVEFTKVNPGYKHYIGTPHSVIVTAAFMKYFHTICLRTMILAESGIVEFEPNSILLHQHPYCFREIILSGNRFSFFRGLQLQDLRTLCSKLTNLTSFDLSFNPLSYRNIRYLTKLPHENSFPVCDGEITSCSTTEISKSSFRFNFTENTVSFRLPQKLKSLRLSHYLTNEKLGQKLVLMNASSLEYLDVSYFLEDDFPAISIDGPNNINYIDFTAITSWRKSRSLFQRAKTVILQKTGIEFIIQKNENFFNFIPEVKKLDLAWNNLWQLRDDTFSANANLSSLDLQSNLFDDLPKALLNIDKLVFLDARWNILDNINETMRQYFDRQQKRFGSFKLFVHGNVFKCTCDTYDFVEWLQKTEVTFDEPNNIYLCMLSNGSVTTTLKAYMEFKTLFAECKSKMWLRIGIGLLVSFVVVVVPLAVILNFRWQISYWVYGTFKQVIEKGIKSKFEYDIYVSYSNGSASWVKNILMSKLEQSWGLKMCIEDRDLLAGDSYVDAIADSIQQSRHVIFIITDTFSDRNFGNFEIERAKYEKYARCLQHIIVIVKDISVKNFPTQFGHIWKDLVFINWCDEEDEIGWDKLRMALFSEYI